MVSEKSSRSKSCKHRRVSNVSIKKSLEQDHKTSEDDSETDLNVSQRTKYSQNKHFTQQPYKIPIYHNANGEVSDSETDIDKPLKPSVASKSVSEFQSVRNSHSSQTIPKLDDESESKSEDEPQSMSLLQPHTSRNSAEKNSTKLSSRGSHSNHISPSSGKSYNMKNLRKPNIPAMSSSEYESASEEEEEEEAASNPPLQSKSKSQKEFEAKHHHSLQQKSQSNTEEESEFEEQEKDSHPISSQPQRESESEEESESEGESESKHIRNHPVRVKEELPSPETSFMEYEDHPDNTGRVFHHSEEFLNNSLNFSVGGHGSLKDNISLQNSVPSKSASQQDVSISLFEREHSPVSAPVVDIPPDSCVWMLQVPRSIPAHQLQGQCLPMKLKGGEILDLPNGCWQILEHQSMSLESALSCIVSTGDLSYGIHRLQPNTFWFLKQVPTPIHVESQEQWRKEANPLPIKDLLKMKTSFHKSSSHKMKRVQDASPVQPKKYLKSEDYEDNNLSHPSSSKKKKKKHEKNFGEGESYVKEPHSSKTTNKHHHKVKKHHHSAVHSSELNVSSSSEVQGSDAVKQKKRKRTMEDEVSPKNKRKRVQLENDPSDLGKKISAVKIIVTDANAASEDSSMHKDKKKKKRKHRKSESSERETSMLTGEIEKLIKKKKEEYLEENSSGISKGSKIKIKKDEDASTSVIRKKKKKHKHKDNENSTKPKVKKEEDFWERETSPDYLSRLYLTQIAPDDC